MERGIFLMSSRGIFVLTIFWKSAIREIYELELIYCSICTEKYTMRDRIKLCALSYANEKNNLICITLYV